MSEKIGDYNAALAYHRQALEVLLHSYSLDHISFATTYNNLGMVFAAQDKLSQAMQYHQRALTIRRRVLTNTHPELAASYDNIGVVCYKQRWANTNTICTLERI